MSNTKSRLYKNQTVQSQVLDFSDPVSEQDVQISRLAQDLACQVHSRSLQQVIHNPKGSVEVLQEGSRDN